MLKIIAFATAIAGLPAISGLASHWSDAGAVPPGAPLAIADLPPPDPDALMRHFLCWEWSRTQVLALSAARACSQTFLAIKLGFVPDMTPARYLALSPAEKAQVNRIGYAAWRTWVEANGARVAEYRRTARNLVHGAGS